MAKKETDIIEAKKIDAYKKLIATIPGIELKGDNIPYTSCNGHMFSYFEKMGLLVCACPKKRGKHF